jgi:hypothetical protein
LAGGDSTSVAHWGSTWVAAIERDDADDGFQVELGGERAGRRRFDQIVANVCYRAETRIYSELHVHECYATGGPMKVAAALLKHDRGDCLDQPSTGHESLMNPEPYFFILCSKSYGRQSNFLLSTGFAQIRDLFSHIAGRKNLDLYQTMDHFPGQS